MARKKPLRIGLLTGGGDCPGLNAVIRAIVKTAINDYQAQVVGFKDGYLGLVEGWGVSLSYNDVSGILTRGGTILGTSNKANPFEYLVKRGKGTKKIDASDRVFKTVKKFRLDAVILVGGDGTLSIGKRLYDLGLAVIGIPKTIDNDVMETDVTFGFDSACATATEAIDKIHDTAQSHHRVMIVETMGRYVGWLALHSGVAGGGDVILIPEIPYDINKVCKCLEERGRRGKRFSIVVVAEGARPKGGSLVIRARDEGSHDPIRLGGIGNVLSKEIGDLTGLESRVTVLGHVQRGGTPTPFDRVLATRFGAHAVRLVADATFGQMVSLKGTEITQVILAKAVSELKRVPLDSHLLAVARSVGTVFGD